VFKSPISYDVVIISLKEISDLMGSTFLVLFFFLYFQDHRSEIQGVLKRKKIGKQTQKQKNLVLHSNITAKFKLEDNLVSM